MAGSNQGLPPANLAASSAVADWRAQLPDGLRRSVISRIMEKLPSGLRHFVTDLEKEAYSQAGSKSDYIRKICTTLDSCTCSRKATLSIASFCNLDAGGQATASTDSVASNSHIEDVGSGDQLEETYQKVKSMKDLYLTQVEGLYQNCDKKLQQLNCLLPDSPQSEEQKNLVFFKSSFEDTIQFLKIPKNNIGPELVQNFPLFEKNILAFLGVSQPQRQKPTHAFGAHSVHPPYASKISLQQQDPQPPSYADLVQQGCMQPRASQVRQWNVQAHANQVQQSTMQGSATQMQFSGMPILQYDSLLSLTHDVSTQRGVENTLQPSSSMNTKQPQARASVQKGGAISKRNKINKPQARASVQKGAAISKRNKINKLQHIHLQESEDLLSTNNCQIQPNPNILQKQNEQQIPQLIQQHHRKRLWSTRQSLHLNVHRKKQHDKTQSLMHPIEQHRHMNKAEVPKMEQDYGNQSGFHQQNFSASKRQKLSGKLLNNCAPVLTYSPEELSALSSKISHPRKYHHTFLSTPQGCEPLKLRCSPSSPFSLTPRSVLSPTAEGIEGRLPAVNQQITPQTKAESASIATVRKEFVSPKCSRTIAPTILKAGQGEKAINCLIRAVQSSSMKALIFSISDIASVVSTSNMTAESALNYGFTAAMGKFLAGISGSIQKGRNFMSDDGVAEADKMNRDISALPLNNVLSAANINEHDNDTSKLEPAATFYLKRHNAEVSHILLKEIQEINQRLITTVVSICDEDVNLINAVSEAWEVIVIKSSRDEAFSPDLKPEEVNLIDVVSEVGEGTIVKCSFSNVALSPDIKSLFTSAQMAHLLPLRLFIPVNYPKCSPIILDTTGPRNQLEDLSMKAISRIMTALRGLSQPMSLKEMATLWDSCSRTVIREYTMQVGGGTFSSSMRLVNGSHCSQSRLAQCLACTTHLKSIPFKFMPVKSKLEEEEEEEVKMEKDCRDKMNWMSSAQLWSSNYSDTSINKNNQTNTNTNTDNKINKCMNEETESPSLECKSRCGGGPLMPFKGVQALTVSSKKEEKAVASLSDFSLLSAGIKVSPSTDTTEDSLNSKARASINSPMGGHLSQQQQQQHQASRKARRCWSPELHHRFVLALQQLGGAQVATPKQIRELMKVDGLTNDEVKSHLQRYRLHTRRVPNKSQVNGPIMAVGGLWVPQDQYTALSQQSASLSKSPQGPLQLASSARAVSVTAGDSLEEDGKSESYSWK